MITERICCRFYKVVQSRDPTARLLANSWLVPIQTSIVVVVMARRMVTKSAFVELIAPPDLKVVANVRFGAQQPPKYERSFCVGVSGELYQVLQNRTFAATLKVDTLGSWQPWGAFYPSDPIIKHIVSRACSRRHARSAPSRVSPMKLASNPPERCTTRRKAPSSVLISLSATRSRTRSAS
jgi:hypothetical protein